MRHMDRQACAVPKMRPKTDKSAAMKLRIKRAYEPAAAGDGARYLVDRLWPRGVKKESLQLVAWLKDLAPSNALRRWFGHDPARWIEFRRRYRAELKSQEAALQVLRDALKRGPVTLVYSAHDEEHNQAVVLRDFLLAKSQATTKARTPQDDRLSRLGRKPVNRPINGR